MKKSDIIDKILETEKQIRRIKSQAALKDLFLFNTDVLGVEDGKSSLKLSRAHREMCKFIDEEKTKYKLSLLPRGHLKSTLITVGRSLQAICDNPQVRILLANATYPLAVSFLDQIKAHLKNNKKLHSYYGDLSKGSSKWSENAIKIVKAGEINDYEKRENTVTVAGITTSLTSQHYDIIIIDDAVNEENITTIDQIKKVYQFYRNCLDLLEPGGELIIIGTRWHDSDLYGWIMNGDRDRPGEIPPSISKDIMSHQFVYKGEQFNIMKRKVVEGSSPIWPEKFTQNHIDMLQREKGPYSFSCQYNNEPIPEANQQFKRSWFRYYIEDDLKNRNLFNFTMVDPAISQEAGSDFTTIVTIALDEYYNWFIREIIRDHMLPNKIIDTMFKVAEIWRPLEMGIEVVAFQKMLAYSIRDEMRVRKKYLPIRELKHASKSKEARIKGLQPGYNAGHIFHKERMPNLEYLEDELLRFPRGSHDDIIDGLASFTEFAVPPKSERSRNFKREYLY